MFEEIDNLSENVLLSDRIRKLMLVLDNNYFTKEEYNFENYLEARELCLNYKEIQVLIETIYDLVIENDELLNKNIDILINKEKELRKTNVEVA